MIINLSHIHISCRPVSWQHVTTFHLWIIYVLSVRGIVQL